MKGGLEEKDGEMEIDFASNKYATHPVDLIEKIISNRDWPYERITEDELSISIKGNSTQYEIALSWIDEHEALHIACAFPLNMAKGRRSGLDELLLRINKKMLIGHFDYWANVQKISYRQTLLLTGGLCPSAAQIETLLMHALEACESHHRSFYLVSNSKISAEKSLHYALFETVGNA